MRATAIYTRRRPSGSAGIGLTTDLTRIPFTHQQSDLNNLFALNGDGDLVAQKNMTVNIQADAIAYNSDNGAENWVKPWLTKNGSAIEQGIQAKLLVLSSTPISVTGVHELEAGDVLGFYANSGVEADIGFAASVPDVTEITAKIQITVLG